MSSNSLFLVLSFRLIKLSRCHFSFLSVLAINMMSPAYLMFLRSNLLIKRPALTLRYLRIAMLPRLNKSGELMYSYAIFYFCEQTRIYLPNKSRFPDRPYRSNLSYRIKWFISSSRIIIIISCKTTSNIGGGCT